MIYTSKSDNHVYPRKFQHAGWPTDDMVPVGSLATAIAEYFARYRDHEHLPAGPWNSRLGQVWLPELGADGPLEPLAEHDEMPRYRTARTSFVNSTPYPADVEVSTPAWPTDATLQPVNPEARRVQAYYRKYRATGHLKSRPFDPQTRTVDLPAIASLEQAAAERRENPPLSVRTVA